MQILIYEVLKMNVKDELKQIVLNADDKELQRIISIIRRFNQSK